MIVGDDLERNLRAVTVNRNYALSLLVISACAKLVKHLAKMPTEESLYMRAILSVFAGGFRLTSFVVASF